MIRRNITIGFALAAALAAGLWYWQRSSTVTASNAVAGVQTAVLERGVLVAAVNASGTLAAAQTAALNWQTSGVIGKVAVTVGSLVKAGDTLIELAPESYSPAVQQAQIDVFTLQDSLDALLAGSSAEIVAKAKLAVVEAEAAVTAAQTKLTNASSVDVDYYATQSVKADNALSAAQQNAEITNFQVALQAAAKAVQDAGKVIDDIKGLNMNDSRNQPEAVYTRLKAAQATYDSAQLKYQTEIYKFEQAQKSDVAGIQAAQAAADTAKSALADARYGPSAATIALHQAQLDLAQANLLKAQAELAELQAGPDEQAVAAARLKLATAKSTVQLVRLVAPFAGTVAGVSNKAGDSVNNNEPALVLADLSTLEIKVDVAEMDINRVQIGQAVNVVSDAAPGKTFTGKISVVPFLGASQQGVVTFPVMVVVPQPDPALKPGMTVAVSIVTERRADVLLVPNRAIRVANGRRTVSVLTEGEQIEVPITLGLTTETYSEALNSLLKEGDAVVLNPASSRQAGPAGLFGLFGGGPPGGGGSRGGN